MVKTINTTSVILNEIRRRLCLRIKLRVRASEVDYIDIKSIAGVLLNLNTACVTMAMRERLLTYAAHSSRYISIFTSGYSHGVMSKTPAKTVRDAPIGQVSKRLLHNRLSTNADLRFYQRKTNDALIG